MNVKRPVDTAFQAYKELMLKGLSPLESLIMSGCALGIMLGAKDD